MSKYRVSKTDPQTREAIRRNTAAVLPDSPSAMGMKPHEIRAALCRAIISENGKGSVMDEMDRVVDEINIALSDDHLQIERITVTVSEWTDGSPYQAYVWLPSLGGINESETTKTYAALLIPMNEATRAAAQETELVIGTTSAFVGGTIQATLVRQNAAPEVPLEFTVVAFAMDNKTGESFKATAAFVGVSALPKYITDKIENIDNDIPLIGSATVPVSGWQDVLGSYLQKVTIPNEQVRNGDVVMVLPETMQTKLASANLRVEIETEVIDGETSDRLIFTAESKPEIALYFRYAIIRAGADSTASAVAILAGVDAVGAGGDSIDAAGAEAIVKRLVPEWARASDPPSETDPTVPSWAKEETKPGYSKSEVGLGNVDNVRQYSANNPPPYPVTSVNGKTGAVNLTIPSKASDVGADAAGTAVSKISEHNADGAAHNDIRLLIQAHQAEVNALLNSDDETLNETKEIVAYIKSNKALIDAITASKVNVADIIDNLTTTVTNKPLSAKQGSVLKGLIDSLTNAVNGKQTAEQVSQAISTALAAYLTTAKAAETYQPKGSYLTETTGDARYAKTSAIPTKTSQLTNDSSFAVTTKAETWTFTIKSGSTVTKKVVLA